MTGEKLQLLIETEKNKIEKLKAKKAECEDKIRKSEAKLHQYEMMANNEKFTTLANLVQKSGLSVEDVLVALQNGDLLSLQEQIESAQNASQESANAYAD